MEKYGRERTLEDRVSLKYYEKDAFTKKIRNIVVGSCLFVSGAFVLWTTRKQQSFVWNT